MACEHKRLKSVNCVLYCMDCGAKLGDAAAAGTSSGAQGAPPDARRLARAYGPPKGKAFGDDGASGGKAEKAKRTRKKAET